MIPAVTGSLARITIPPHFGQSPAALTWEKKILRWSGSFGFGFLSPQPPGIVGTGPNAESNTGPTSVGPFSFCVARFCRRLPMACSISSLILRSARPSAAANGADIARFSEDRGQCASIRAFMIRDGAAAPPHHEDHDLASYRERLSAACAQCSSVYAAPSIGPGFSRLPSWT